MAVRKYNPFLKYDNIHWRDTLLEYDAGGLLIYIGKSLVPNASQSVGNLWYISKCTYDVSDQLVRVEWNLIGNWNDRAALDWA